MERLVVLGAGESGLGAAYLGVRKGFEVFVSDSGKISPARASELDSLGVHWEANGHTLDRLLEADVVVKSPGIPETASVVVALRAAGKPVISEIEFAARFTNAKKICITGSNGKTTTTNLIYHMLSKAGLRVGMAGNVGSSFARMVADCDYDYYVLELSSFQLDDMYNFRADIAILLNITPDHLDRYDYDMEKYTAAKFRITRNMTSRECFVFCSDDAVTVGHLKDIVVLAQSLPFSQRVEEGQSAYLRSQQVCFGVPDRESWCMGVDELSLRGRHNVYNSMAAGITGELLKIRKEVIRESLRDFQAIEHRLEFVREVNGVQYVNDSKATNVNAVWYALESMTRPVVWIAGGTDKGNDYEELMDVVRGKVRVLICLGVDNLKLKKSFKDVIGTIVEVDSARAAVAEASRLARRGDVVLLSPACASFDLFENYEDRGNQFKQCVEEYARGVAGK